MTSRNLKDNKKYNCQVKTFNFLVITGNTSISRHHFMSNKHPISRVANSKRAIVFSKKSICEQIAGFNSSILFSGGDDSRLRRSCPLFPLHPLMRAYTIIILDENHSQLPRQYNAICNVGHDLTFSS